MKSPNLRPAGRAFALCWFCAWASCVLADTNQAQLTIGFNGANQTRLTWAALSNTVFGVEACSNLALSSWSLLSLTNLQTTDTGVTITATDTRPPVAAQFYRLRQTSIGRFGAHSSLGNRTNMPAYLNDLGASWARVNASLDGNDPPFTNFLAAGINLVVTFANRDPANLRTNYGTLADWPNGGFPFASSNAYVQRIRDSLAPALPYTALGAQVWVQCENEIGDASVAPTARYWRGTTSDYLLQLPALFQAVRSLQSSNLSVVLTSFASENLNTVLNPADPNYAFQTNRMITLLQQNSYDAADLHFYGCVSDIPAKIQWVKDHLPAGRKWISTENGGPDYRCAATPVHWSNNPTLFESIQAAQVTNRLDAVATNGASIALWFSLFDLNGETDVFNHLGLIEQTNVTVRLKPAYNAFKNYTASHP